MKPIPTIKEPPLLGSMLEHNKDRLNLYLRIARECGDIGLFHIAAFPLILVNASELVHSMLVEHASDTDKGEVIRRAFRPVIGNGLLISEGDFHRRQRKLIAPSFQPRHIVSYADTMVSYGEQVQQAWNDGMMIDIGQEMTRITMSIVGKVLFDANVFTESDELGAAMTATMMYANYAMSSLVPIPFNWPTPRNLHAKRAIAVLRKRIQKMIDERRASSTERNDFLSILLHAREEDGTRMSDQQVYDEAITLFGAGHETTATALTWAWYLLATHPDAYQKMLQEVDSVLQGRAPTYADLAHLPYTLQVFKEAMRLYPPAYAFSRAVLNDFELGGYQIHKDDALLVSPYVMHRKPEYFPDPEKFEPERFTPENEKRLPRYAYIPFGAGPRICIGNYFAMMEGHLLLATLAQHVTFDLVPSQQVEPDPLRAITIRPKYPLKMVVRRRVN